MSTTSGVQPYIYSMYRFSVSPSDVVPTGSFGPDETSKEELIRLVSGIRKAIDANENITPFVDDIQDKLAQPAGVLAVYDNERFKFLLVHSLQKNFENELKNPAVGSDVESLKIVLNDFLESYTPRYFHGKQSSGDPYTVSSIGVQIICTNNQNPNGGPLKGLNTTRHNIFMNMFERAYYLNVGPKADHEKLSTVFRHDVRPIFPEHPMDNFFNADMYSREQDIRQLVELSDILNPIINHSDASKVQPYGTVLDQIERMVKSKAVDISNLVRNVYQSVKSDLEAGYPGYLTLSINGSKFSERRERNHEFGLHAFVINIYRINGEDWLVINNHGPGTTKAEIGESRHVRPRMLNIGIFTEQLVSDLFSVQTQLHLPFDVNIDRYQSILDGYEIKKPIPSCFLPLIHKDFYKKEMRGGACVVKSYDAAIKTRLSVFLFKIFSENYKLSNDDAANLAVKMMKLFNRERKQLRDTWLHFTTGIGSRELKGVERQFEKRMVGDYDPPRTYSRVMRMVELLDEGVEYRMNGQDHRKSVREALESEFNELYQWVLSRKISVIEDAMNANEKRFQSIKRGAEISKALMERRKKEAESCCVVS